MWLTQSSKWLVFGVGRIFYTRSRCQCQKRCIFSDLDLFSESNICIYFHKNQLFYYSSAKSAVFLPRILYFLENHNFDPSCFRNFKFWKKWFFVRFELMTFDWRQLCLPHPVPFFAFYLTSRMFLVARGQREVFSSNQGCQIFLGKTYQNVKNIPNDHKL
jgi:hypothetical protein